MHRQAGDQHRRRGFGGHQPINAPGEIGEAADHLRVIVFYDETSRVMTGDFFDLAPGQNLIGQNQPVGVSVTSVLVNPRSSDVIAVERPARRASSSVLA